MVYYLNKSRIEDEENNDVFELLLDAVDELPLFGLFVGLFVVFGTWVDTESNEDCLFPLLLLLLLVIFVNIEVEADNLADIELVLLLLAELAEWVLDVIVVVAAAATAAGGCCCCCCVGVEISEDAFCEIADNAPAAMFALAWALEAIVFAFLNWLDGK